MSDFYDSRREELDALFTDLGLDPIAGRKALEEEDGATAWKDDAVLATARKAMEQKDALDAAGVTDETEYLEVMPTPVEPVTEAEDESAPEQKVKKHRIRRFFGSLIPRKGDSGLEIFRKCLCVIALLVFVGSACVLLDDFVLTPMRNRQVSDANLQRQVDPLTSEEANFDGYPSGILEHLKKNYYHNHDLIGWITYPSESTYWHGINYAVVQRPGDNDYYLRRDFDEKENKNGSIFMDYRCDYATRDSRCRVTLIYGHNMRSGQMFASLNQLLDGVSMARCSPTLTFSSLFEENQYKVFAVFNSDTAEEGAYDFLNQNITYATSDEDFLRYIAEMRVRSWYNYGDVDVRADDEIVLLYTCSNTYQTTMGSSGRTLVAARKVRTGESPIVDTSTITENSTCVMPKVWYANKNLPLPSYYSTGLPAEMLASITTTPSSSGTTTLTTTTSGTTTTTTTTTPDDDDDDETWVPATQPATTKPAASTTKPTTAPTEPTMPPTEPEPTTPPTEPEPTEPEPTEPEPTEPAGPGGPDLEP